MTDTQITRQAKRVQRAADALSRERGELHSLIREALAGGMTVRHAASLTGVSHQRIQQLKSRPS